MSDIRLVLHESPECRELLAPLLALERDVSLGFPAARQPGTAAELAPGARVLHFAPGRWLLTGTAPELEAGCIERLSRVGALSLDGRAKWCVLELHGADAPRVLSGLLAVEQVMGTRGCAAATLLDCPGVLATSAAGLEYWVGRSWARWLHDTLAAWLSRRAPRCARDE